MRPLMVQGTASGVGKSLLVAGLLRVFAQEGLRVAPFKAQNMALNSYITADGAEIGRAQALQAEAAGVEPLKEMNPVLLKALGEAGCQVVLMGRVLGNYTARQYYCLRDFLWGHILKAYEALSRRFDLVVIEGAGSPAEINLQDEDMVNMAVARQVGARVLLVGDIDRGGVFASLLGTMALLEPRDRALVRGLVINKFRGDRAILEPGLRELEARTGLPVLGALPYLRGALPEEDGLSLESCLRERPRGQKALRGVVIALPRISNFTDFDPFLLEPDVELLYSLRPWDILGADLLLLPGTKSTIQDLRYLRSTGVLESIRRAAERGTPLVGICGGYQMLGHVIRDPHGLEGNCPEARGLGLLDVETSIQGEKVTTQVLATDLRDGQELRGYEIHKGRSEGAIGLFRLRRLATSEELLDGSQRGSVWGTYMHGVFENDHFRAGLLNRLRERRGLQRREPLSYAAFKARALDVLAQTLREHLDMRSIWGLIKG